MQGTTADSRLRQRVIETALALLLVLLLIAATFRILLPFAGVLTYAVILATATAGLFERMAKLLNGRRRLAAFLFGVLAAVITVVPLIYFSSAVADAVPIAQQWRLSAVSSHNIPNLPDWIAGLPLIGDKLTSAWRELQLEGLGVLQHYQPQLVAAGGWLLDLSLGLAGAVLEIFLGVIVAAIMHASGSGMVASLSAIAERIAGSEGARLLDAARRAIQGVAIGVIGTALLEGLLAWIGFAIAGVPGAVALAALTFLLATIQVGPLLVWLPVAIWLASQGQIGWAIFLAVWGVVLLMGADNIVKPILIARSGQLPTLVLFVGVIGGLAAWGFTGMFIGATTLAILWTVLQAWLGTKEHPTGTADSAPHD
jgi:predicted PurR-regulated permease PerM